MTLLFLHKILQISSTKQILLRSPFGQFDVIWHTTGHIVQIVLPQHLLRQRFEHRQNRLNSSESKVHYVQLHLNNMKRSLTEIVQDIFGSFLYRFGKNIQEFNYMLLTQEEHHLDGRLSRD